MPFFLKLLYFLQTGRTRPETREEVEARLHSDRLWGTKTRRISGIKIILICFFSLAIIAKLVLQAVTGSSFDLDLRTGFSLLYGGAIVLCFIWVLRRLFVWRYGASENAGEFPQSSGCGMVVLIVIGAVSLLTLYKRHSYDASLERKSVPLVDTAPESESEAERADTPADYERQALIARLDELYNGVNSRWRADVAAAGASGKLGEIPPVLDVTAKAPDVWQVRNLARSPACVRLIRVAELPGGRVQRCRLDAATECVEISAGMARQIALAPQDGSPGCREAKLEFRVGTPTLPEPSWWSATALKDFDVPDEASSKPYTNWTAGRLRGEITLLESIPADPNRAARWRRELSR